MMLAKILNYFGAMILCHSLSTTGFSRRHGWTKFLSVVTTTSQLILLAIMVAIQLEEYILISEIPIISSLSVRIQVAIAYVALIVPFIMIRTCTLVYPNEILSFGNNSVVAWPLQSDYVALGRYAKFWLIFSTTLHTSWFLAQTTYCLFVRVLFVTTVSPCNLYLMPCNNTILKAAYAMCNLAETTSILYAWCWLVYHGMMLVNRLNTFGNQCDAILGGTGELNAADAIEEDSVFRVYQLVNAFQSIDAEFRMYSNIGGSFAWALVVHFTFMSIAVLILLFSNVLAEAGQGVATVYSIFITFPGLLSVVFFGQWLKYTVSSLLSSR